MKRQKFIVAFFSMFFIWACTPEPLDIEIPQADPKLVVYSQALPAQGLVVALTKSFSALTLPEEQKDSTKQDSINNLFLSQFLVDNALVTLNGPDYNDTLLPIANGVYLATLFPATPGLTYNLKAFDPQTGFSVDASTSALPIVNFDTVYAKRKFEDDSSTISVHYSIDDPPGEQYYLLNIYSDSIPQGNFFSFSGNNNHNSIAFSDREFPQNEVKGIEQYEIGKSDTVVVTLTNISRDFFDYIKARERSDNSFLSEPVSYPSNVNNGLGFFNIHQPSARVIEID